MLSKTNDFVQTRKYVGCTLYLDGLFVTFGRSYAPDVICHLYIVDAPEIIPINSTLNYVSLGQELHLQCGYAGVPAPTVRWFYNNSLLTSGLGGVSITGEADGDNISSLVLDDVDQTSGGVYMCWTNNLLGSAVINYTVIIVGASFSS